MRRAEPQTNLSELQAVYLWALVSLILLHTERPSTKASGGDPGGGELLVVAKAQAEELAAGANILVVLGKL